MSVDQAFNFRKIDTRVASSGVVSAEQLATLADEGFEAVINLMPDSSEYAVAGERDIVTGQGLDYRYIPVDFSAPTEQDYSTFVDAMTETSGRRLLVHCAANYRVSAFFAVYAFEHLGWSGAEAEAHIASIWNPPEHPPWQAFIDRHLNRSTASAP